MDPLKQLPPSFSCSRKAISTNQSGNDPLKLLLKAFKIHQILHLRDPNQKIPIESIVVDVQAPQPSETFTYPAKFMFFSFPISHKLFSQPCIKGKYIILNVMLLLYKNNPCCYVQKRYVGVFPYLDRFINKLFSVYIYFISFGRSKNNISTLKVSLLIQLASQNHLPFYFPPYSCDYKKLKYLYIFQKGWPINSPSTIWLEFTTKRSLWLCRAHNLIAQNWLSYHWKDRFRLFNVS